MVFNTIFNKFNQLNIQGWKTPKIRIWHVENLNHKQYITVSLSTSTPTLHTYFATVSKENFYLPWTNVLIEYLFLQM